MHLLFNQRRPMCFSGRDSFRDCALSLLFSRWSICINDRRNWSDKHGISVVYVERVQSVVFSSNVVPQYQLIPEQKKIPRTNIDQSPFTRRNQIAVLRSKRGNNMFRPIRSNPYHSRNHENLFRSIRGLIMFRPKPISQIY